MKPIRPQPGSASNPDDFVGRAGTTQRAAELLAAGSNLALTDPRRMGKTYWMRNFCATSDDFSAVVQIDYEGIDTQAGFLTRTAESLGREQRLPQKARRFMSALFENVESVGLGAVTIKPAVATLSPQRLLRDTVMAVGKPTDKPVLLCMDEVPVAIRNIALNEGASPARELLQTLRALRHADDVTGIRWIVCGSVGFHHVLKLCQATEGEINDLVNLPLGPLSQEDAEELAGRLFLGIERVPDAGAITVIVERTGGVPFLLHQVAWLLQVRGTGPVSGSEVAAAFDDFVDDRDESRAVTHLVTRLDPYYGSDAQLATRMLNAVAMKKTVPLPDLLEDAKAGERFNEVLNALIDDHYLIERGMSVSWRYDVLRRIWSRRHRLNVEHP